MNKDLIYSLGLGIFIIVMFSLIIDIPKVVFSGVSSFAFLIVWGQFYQKGKEIEGIKEKAKKRRAIIGKCIILSSFPLTFTFMLLMYTFGDELADKLSNAFTLLSLMLTLFIVAIFDK